MSMADEFRQSTKDFLVQNEPNWKRGLGRPQANSGEFWRYTEEATRCVHHVEIEKENQALTDIARISHCHR